jgi:hypothetical protein
MQASHELAEPADKLEMMGLIISTPGLLSIHQSPQRRECTIDLFDRVVMGEADTDQAAAFKQTHQNGISVSPNSDYNHLGYNHHKQFQSWRARCA